MTVIVSISTRAITPTRGSLGFVRNRRLRNELKNEISIAHLFWTATEFDGGVLAGLGRRCDPRASVCV